MSSSAVPTKVQETNQASVDAQKARYWDIPNNPNLSHTTAAADWERRAKESGLT